MSRLQTLDRRLVNARPRLLQCTFAHFTRNGRNPWTRIAKLDFYVTGKISASILVKTPNTIAQLDMGTGTCQFSC